MAINPDINFRYRAVISSLPKTMSEMRDLTETERSVVLLQIAEHLQVISDNVQYFVDKAENEAKAKSGH